MTRILLVAGNADDREWVRDRLKAVGHDVVCGSDATTAVDRLEQRSFGMVVTDWMLRDISGLEFAHYVRRHANGRLTRVVDDHLTMPVCEEELVARVSAALRRPVDVHVRRLRAALEPHSCESLLQTVRGFGYRFG